ncbi:MAG: exo-beta-N-acetylmuramidase NamZ family protein [Gemmatimonadaceae bacterium]
MSALLRLLVVTLIAVGCAAPPRGQADARTEERTDAGTLTGRVVSDVRPGLDAFLVDLPEWAKGKRLGLITNVAGVDRAGRLNLDVLAPRTDVRLVALFAFEHGLRGDAPAGQPIPSGTDPKTGLPVWSLYGEIREPTAEMLRGIDLLLYDVQDVGARPYTRISTMALSMQAAKKHGIPFVVLDRPNPLGGEVVEGPVLDTAFRSFVGMYPTPLRHGMTVGELARLYNEQFGIGVTLHVVPVAGWHRRMYFDVTGLPFVPPSPNIRRIQAALLYPGTVLIEGTNLSEGRGTATPFEHVGAPWLRSVDVVRAMTARDLPGVRFEATELVITADGRKFGGQTVPGVRLVVTDRGSFRAVRTAMLLIDTIRRLHPSDFAWGGANRREPGLMTIDRLAGTDTFRKAVESGTLDAMFATWDAQAARFRALRERYLLYR